MTKKGNPGRGARGAGHCDVDRANERVRRDYLSSPLKKKVRLYWLHVADDGTEQHIAKQPDDRPTLRVEVVEDRDDVVVERTWTRRVPVDGYIWKCVPPPGDGWEFESEDRDSASWVRQREVRS